MSFNLQHRRRKPLLLVLGVVLCFITLATALVLISSPPVDVAVKTSLSITSPLQIVNVFAGSNVNVTWTVTNAANNPVSATANLSGNLTYTNAKVVGGASLPGTVSFIPGTSLVIVTMTVSASSQGNYQVILNLQPTG